MKNKFSSIWESNLQVQDDSTSSDVDGVNILARVVGPAFFPDTTSKNNVHYPRRAWENAISYPEFQERLRERRIYGTIGHDIELDDSQIRDGNFSHIVTKVWIDENGIGNAEYLVLNTPPGRILNTILRAKSKIFVSTKAAGEYLNVSEGIKTVDPDVFFLERIDFVIDPGYLQANPQLLESYNKALFTDKKDMTTISESKIQESLNKYKELGTPEEIHKCLEALQDYVKLGSAKSIKESLEKSNERISQLTKIIENKFSDVTEALHQDEMKTLLESYKELGTPAEIRQLIKVACNQHKQLMEAKAGEIAKKFNISESFVRKQYNKGMKMSDIEEMLHAFREEDETKEEEVPEVETEVEVPDDEEGDETEVETTVEEPETEEVEEGDDDSAEDDIDFTLDEVVDEPATEEEEVPVVEKRRIKECDSRRGVYESRKPSSKSLAKLAAKKKIAESHQTQTRVSSLVAKLMK